MCMRIVGIPVIYSQPFQLRAQLALQARHHFADKGLEIAQRFAILGGNDQPEMPSVLCPPGRDRLAVDTNFRAIVEGEAFVSWRVRALQIIDRALKPRLAALGSFAVARQIAHMRPQRRALA